MLLSEDLEHPGMLHPKLLSLSHWDQVKWTYDASALIYSRLSSRESGSVITSVYNIHINMHYLQDLETCT